MCGLVELYFNRYCTLIVNMLTHRINQHSHRVLIEHGMTGNNAFPESRGMGNWLLKAVQMLSVSSSAAGSWWASWWTLAAAPCEEVATTACASSFHHASARHPPASRAVWSSDTSWRLCRPWWRVRGWRAGWWRWARLGLSFWGRYFPHTHALVLSCFSWSFLWKPSVCVGEVFQQWDGDSAVQHLDFLLSFTTWHPLGPLKHRSYAVLIIMDFNLTHTWLCGWICV